MIKHIQVETRTCDHTHAFNVALAKAQEEFPHKEHLSIELKNVVWMTSYGSGCFVFNFQVMND